MDIKFYIKYLYISHGILVGILYFGTHHIGNGEAKDGENFFKEFIVIRGG